MSQKLVFVCEICRGEFTDPNGIIGFEFEGDGSLKKIVEKPPRDVHRHFCAGCDRMTKRMLNEAIKTG